MDLRTTLTNKQFIVFSTGISVHLHKAFPNLSGGFVSLLGASSALLFIENNNMMSFQDSISEVIDVSNQLFREALPPELVTYLVANIQSMYRISYSDYEEGDDDED